ncbi:MAG: DNA sulfur modification protein DndB [Bdellovibrionaceae bacterium]|nr:DNA sulfur modification protein DndB [Pseudobdellovibrionaceae bacterium]
MMTELKFPALRGKMGRKEFYVAMVKIKSVPNLFNTYLEHKQNQAEKKEDIDFSVEAQRAMNLKRIPEISQYIQDTFSTNTKYTYVFNSITANCEMPLKFVPLKGSPDIGTLIIRDLEQFTVADGQHRLMGIKNAYHEMSDKNKKEFGNESIAVVFFDVRDPKSGRPDIKRKHQIFTDLNRSAKLVSKSALNAMGGRPNEQVTRFVISNFPGFSNRVEMEKSHPKRSSEKLFSAASIGDANTLLFGSITTEKIQETEQKAKLFWEKMYEAMPEWKNVVEGKEDPSYLKDKYLWTHAVVLRAIATVAAKAYSIGGEKAAEQLFKKMKNFDWRRTNPSLKRILISEAGHVHNAKTVERELVQYLCKTFGV